MLKILIILFLCLNVDGVFIRDPLPSNGLDWIHASDTNVFYHCDKGDTMIDEKGNMSVITPVTFCDGGLPYDVYVREIKTDQSAWAKESIVNTFQNLNSDKDVTVSLIYNNGKIESTLSPQESVTFIGLPFYFILI